MAKRSTKSAAARQPGARKQSAGTQSPGAVKPKRKAAPKRTRYGYKQDGEWVIPPQFEDARPFHHGLAAVQVDGVWGYIDRSGRLVIEPRFFTAGLFLGGLFAQVEEQRGRPFYVDREGRFAFLAHEQASDGLFAMRTEGSFAWDAKWGYRDATSGATVIEPRFASAGAFFGEHATASTWIPDVGGRFGLINRRGEWVVPPEYVLANGVDQRGGIFASKDEGGTFHWGIVHPTGGVVVPFEPHEKPFPLRPLASRVQALPPRTADDAALEVGKAKVAVPPPADPAVFPFRFYGMGVSDGERRLVYRVRFAGGVDVGKAAAELRAELASAVEVEGAFAAVWLDDVYEVGASMVEADSVEVFRSLHARFPITEVVNLAVTDVADSEWSRWSVRMQERPDDGPLFGETPAW